MRIAIGSDHAGYRLKALIIASLKEAVEFIDVGTYDETPVDYPDYAEKVCSLINEGRVDCGILVCGTGIGMSIAANKFPNIRAALVYSDETASLAKRHNNANVLCFGGRTMDYNKVVEWIKIWLNESFEGGRHLRRIEKINELERRIRQL